MVNLRPHIYIFFPLVLNIKKTKKKERKGHTRLFKYDVHDVIEPQPTKMQKYLSMTPIVPHC